MDLSLSSEPNAGTVELVFRSVKGAVIESPLEWVPAWVEIVGLSLNAFSDVRLTCQGTTLEVLPRQIPGIDAGNNARRLLAEWPRMGTGHYRLEWRYGKHAQSKTVRVQSEKISPAAYAHLLEDLERRLPTSIAIALQRLGGFAGIRFLPPAETTVAQEFHRLQRAICGTGNRAGLVDVLQILAPDPHRVLRTHEMWTPVERARRPVPARLAWAVARPGNMNRQVAASVESPGAWLPHRVLDARVEHTVDVFENRLLHLLYDQVQRRLRRLANRLSQMPGQKILLDSTLKLLDSLRQARRSASFLDEVTLPSHLPNRTTMVLLKRPPYRAALEGYLELHRSTVVRIEEPALEAPLENLPYLYQVWCTLQVVQTLAEEAEFAGYTIQSHSLFRRDSSGFFLELIPNGQSILTLNHQASGTEVRLIPECTYGKTGALHSVSFSQRPDIAIEIHRPGSPVQVLLFDPKYKLDSELIAVSQDNIEPADSEQWKDLLQEHDAATPGEPSVPLHATGKPKKVDIDKMHTYRDAIQDLSNHKVVEYAAIIYPGRSISYNAGLEAICGYPGADELLRTKIRTILRNFL